MHEPGMDTLTSIRAFRRVIESGSFVASHCVAVCNMNSWTFAGQGGVSVQGFPE